MHAQPIPTKSITKISRMIVPTMRHSHAKSASNVRRRNKLVRQTNATNPTRPTLQAHHPRTRQTTPTPIMNQTLIPTIMTAQPVVRQRKPGERRRSTWRINRSRSAMNTWSGLRLLPNIRQLILHYCKSRTNAYERSNVEMRKNSWWKWIVTCSTQPILSQS